MRKYKFFKDPVPYITINNVFEKDVADKMFAEIVSLKDGFAPAQVGKIKRVDKKMRDNSVLFLDLVYGQRSDSIILSSIDGLLMDDQFQQVLSSSAYPMIDITLTDTHETQISRYGNDNQNYSWHIDRLGQYNRHITIVYYFNNPKKWKGGDVQLTDTPVLNGSLISDNYKTATYTPEPNSALVFGASTVHTVKPTTSSDVFEEGRFSANIWVGVK